MPCLATPIGAANTNEDVAEAEKPYGLIAGRHFCYPILLKCLKQFRT